MHFYASANEDISPLEMRVRVVLELVFLAIPGAHRKPHNAGKRRSEAGAQTARR
jgi:hypothetical protein